MEDVQSLQKWLMGAIITQTTYVGSEPRYPEPLRSLLSPPAPNVDKSYLAQDLPDAVNQAEISCLYGCTIPRLCALNTDHKDINEILGIMPDFDPGSSSSSVSSRTEKRQPRIRHKMMITSMGQLSKRKEQPQMLQHVLAALSTSDMCGTASAGPVHRTKPRDSRLPSASCEGSVLF